MEIRVAHDLEPGEVVQRVRLAARQHDLELQEDGEHSGSLAKVTALGTVRARWSAAAGELLVIVEERPAFLPKETVRRLLEEGLREVLSG